MGKAEALIRRHDAKMTALGYLRKAYGLRR